MNPAPSDRPERANPIHGWEQLPSGGRRAERIAGRNGMRALLEFYGQARPRGRGGGGKARAIAHGNRGRQAASRKGPRTPGDPAVTRERWSVRHWPCGGFNHEPTRWLRRGSNINPAVSGGERRMPLPRRRLLESQGIESQRTGKREAPRSIQETRAGRAPVNPAEAVNPLSAGQTRHGNRTGRSRRFRGAALVAVHDTEQGRMPVHPPAPGVGEDEGHRIPDRDPVPFSPRGW